MRILITRTDRIGDVMLSTPVFRAVREFFPNARITACVEKAAIGIVERNPYIDDIIIQDKKGKHRTISGMYRFIRIIAKSEFDMAIILHPTKRMNLACFLAGIPKRIGYNKKWGGLLTDRLPHKKEKGEKHELEYTLDVVRHIGIEPKDKSMLFPLDEETLKMSDIILKENGLKDGEKFIALHPGASCPSKRWPVERFAGLAYELWKRYHYRIVIVGEKYCIPLAGKIAELSKIDICDTTGRTDLKTLAGILKKAELFISNDSGPVHIAVAVGKPVISIFGRKDKGLSPKRWGPLGPKDISLHKDVGCNVCLAHNCKIGFKCLDVISIEDVLEAAKKIL